MDDMSRLRHAALLHAALCPRPDFLLHPALRVALPPPRDNDQFAQFVPRQDRKGAQTHLRPQLPQSVGTDNQHHKPSGHQRRKAVPPHTFQQRRRHPARGGRPQRDIHDGSFRIVGSGQHHESRMPRPYFRRRVPPNRESRFRRIDEAHPPAHQRQAGKHETNRSLLHRPPRHAPRSASISTGTASSINGPCFTTAPSCWPANTICPYTISRLAD